MRKLFIVTILVLLASVSAFAEAKLCPTTVPADARLDQYPPSSGPLADVQQANMHLRFDRLPFEFRGYNLHRELNPNCGGTWVLEVIPAGEMVLIGLDGYVAYRVSCGNRLVHFALPPARVPEPPKAAAPTYRLRYLWQGVSDIWNWLWYRYE